MLRCWMILVPAVARLASVMDGLVEDRVRRKMRDEIINRKKNIEKNEKMKKLALKRKKDTINLKTIARAIGSYVTRFRVKKRQKEAKMLGKFISECSTNLRMTSTIKTYSQKIKKCQHLWRGFVWCR